MKLLGSCAFFSAVFLIFGSSYSAAAEAPLHLTLLHTNDLHSHFRPDRSPLHLGGLAKIKTTADRLRIENPHSLLVDGGDWSEGNIYYALGAGVETLTMMDKMGYDVAVVGNHDFLNGPDILTGVLDAAKPKMSLIATNVNLEHYKNAEALRKHVLPYVIKEVGGYKIAFIGLTTYELIYDRFFSPVKITEPFFATQTLAAKLKKEVDAVIVLSHNSIWSNKWILRMSPAVDLVIGAHDHVKLDKPIVVNRWGAKPGWIVETGSWGRYLGKVEMEISRQGVELKNYNLIQMDYTVPEDLEISSRIEKLETRLEEKYGPIFSAHVGTNDLELAHSGEENLIGNLVTDSYVKNTGADFAIESNTAIYGDLYPGDVRLVDIFNVYPAIFNPTTGKTWTLKKIPIKGSNLRRLLNIIYASRQIRSYGSLSVSGISYTIDPIFLNALNTMDINPLDLNKPMEESELKQIMGFPIVKDIRIQDVPIDLNKTYTMATGGMLVAGFELINSIISIVPLDGLIDTDVEVWKAIGGHVQKHSPISRKTVQIGGRVTPQGPELGIYAADITLETTEKTAETLRGRLRVHVTNYGKSPSTAGLSEKGAHLQIQSNLHGIDESDPVYHPLLGVVPIPAVLPGHSWDFDTEVKIPAARSARGITPFFPVTVRLVDGRGNLGPTNKMVTRLFQ
jgi:5'-nucleotidase/UDP-sugar diphosphatase